MTCVILKKSTESDGDRNANKKVRTSDLICHIVSSSINNTIFIFTSILLHLQIKYPPFDKHCNEAVFRNFTALFIIEQREIVARKH